MKRIHIALWVGVALLASSSPAPAQLFYGVATDNTLEPGLAPETEFGTIDPDTWALNPIGVTAEPDFAVDSNEGRYRGLAYNSNDGLLYAAIRGWKRGGDPDLVTIDPATGQVIDFVQSNMGPLTTGLTYDADTNLIYSTVNRDGNQIGTSRPLSSGSSGGPPVEIPNKSGTGQTDELVGLLGGKFYALAINPDDGLLYSIGDVGGFTTIATIDKRTGAREANVARVMGGLEDIQAMTFRNGSIIATANSTGSPQESGAGEHGGFELWQVELDGSAVMLNPDMGQFVDAIEFAPENGAPGTDIAIIAGDGNLDGMFDTTDIVLALAGNLFETNNEATWEQGDWNGAPNQANTYASLETGGGTPPAGDNRFNTDDVVAALAGLTFETGSVLAALKDPKKGEGTDQVVVTYNAPDGNVSVNASQPITSISLESASGIFTGSPAANLGGPFDVDTDVKVSRPYLAISSQR